MKPPTESAPTKRSRRRALLRIVVLVLIGLAAFEVVARIVFPGFRIEFYWSHHPVLGWTQVPGLKWHEEVEGEMVWLEFNEAGFHDVAHEVERPEGTRRIVLVGDSFSEAIQVNLPDTFFRQLERRLCAEGPDRWEVINLGVGDFGTAQECLALEHYGFAYDPEIVLVQIFPLNDITNNSIELRDVSGSDFDHLRPYFVESDSGLELARVQPVRSWLRRNAVSYVTIEAVLNRLFGGERTDAERETDRLARATELGFERDGLPPLFHTFAEDRDQHPAIRRAWTTTERILERIVRQCRERGVKVLPIVVPWEERVGETAWRAFSEKQAPPELLQDYPERRLGALFTRLDVPCLMLKPVFEQHQDAYFPSLRGHLNRAAHAITAQAIHERLRREGMLKR